MLTLPQRGGTSTASPYQPMPGNGKMIQTPAAPSQTDPAAAERPFNLDSAVARIMADAKLVAIIGELEIAVTNGVTVETNIFPLSVHVFDGQVRTEMNIESVSTVITNTGPFSAFRQLGLTRLVNLTQVQQNARVVSQVFPENKCYVSQELPAEEMLMLMKLEKLPAGTEQLGPLACEKTAVSIVYANGSRRTGHTWSVPAALRQVQFDVGATRLTVRVQDSQPLAELRPQDIAEQKQALFELPKDFFKFTRLDDALARLYADQQKRAQRR